HLSGGLLRERSLLRRLGEVLVDQRVKTERHVVHRVWNYVQRTGLQHPTRRWLVAGRVRSENVGRIPGSISFALDHHSLDRCIKEMQCANLVDATPVGGISKVVTVVAEIDLVSLKDVHSLLVGDRSQLTEYQSNHGCHDCPGEDGSDEPVEADPG